MLFSFGSIELSVQADKNLTIKNEIDKSNDFFINSQPLIKLIIWLFILGYPYHFDIQEYPQADNPKPYK